MATRTKKPEPFVVEVLNTEGYRHFWNDVEIDEVTFNKNNKDHEEWIARFQETVEPPPKRKKK
jgi:hypothetical protein